MSIAMTKPSMLEARRRNLLAHLVILMETLQPLAQPGQEPDLEHWRILRAYLELRRPRG